MKKMRFKGDFIVFYILAAVALAAGLVIMLWDKAHEATLNSITYLIGVGIMIYAIVALAPNLIKRRNSVVKAYMIVEISLVILMALGMFLSSLRFINVTECQAIGLCIWCRGFVEIVRGYYNHGDVHVAGKKSPYDRAAKYVNIALITLGTYVFFNVNINKEKIVTGLEISLIIGAIILLMLAIYCTVNRVGSKKAHKAPVEASNEPEEVKEDIPASEEKEEEPSKKEKRKMNKDR